MISQYHRIRTVSQKRNRKPDISLNKEHIYNNKSFECFTSKKIPDLNPWVVQGDDD